MITHIVLWKLVDEYAGKDRETLAAEFRDRIMAMRGAVPALQSVDCGADFQRGERSWDFALYTTFADRAALDAYQADPIHGEVKAFARAIGREVAAVDFES